jgi:photosystem II stability/assembly factor-like uncharacterized protein
VLVERLPGHGRVSGVRGRQVAAADDPHRLNEVLVRMVDAAVSISQGGSRLRWLPDIPGSTLFLPRSVSFASATRGWAVGTNLAGRAVLLATADGGRSWHSQLPS